MLVTLVSIQDVADGVKTFWFRPERPIRYLPGQFTELYLAHQADQRGTRRWFTLSSSPTEPLLGITTRFVADGSSFKQQLLQLQPGQQLHLAEPMGDFVLPKDTSIPLLFVAAGLGITPVRSMLKWLLDAGEQRDVGVLYSVAHPNELAFHDLFTAFHGHFTPHFTQTSGRLTTGHILDKIQDNTTQIYLSGPEHMVETFYKELQAKGVPAGRLIADYFPGYQ